jgi:putative flippase GtrA
MAIEKTLAIIFLVLLAASRGVLFLFPSQSKEFLNKRVLRLPKSVFIMIGLACALVTLAVFYLLLDSLTLSQMIAAIFGFVMFSIAGYFWHGEFYVSMIHAFDEEEDGWIRMHTGAAVVAALLLLAYVLNSA